MTGTNGELVAQVRQAIDTALNAGKPAPGRPTLVRMTGATDHAVRKALAELSAEKAGVSPTGPGGSPGSGSQGADTSGATGELIASEVASAGGTLSPTGAADASADDQPPVPGAQPAPPGGRFVAWAGFVFGSVMSVAANVLHAWLPAPHQPPGWSPGVAPQIGAAVWPLGLMLAVEALSRIRWPHGLLWSLARFGGAGTVAVGSAVISYGHLRDVLLAWQYGPLAADVGPLVLDGLMVVCGFALLAISRTSTGEEGR
jgi:hypothetical protein